MTITQRYLYRTSLLFSFLVAGFSLFSQTDDGNLDWKRFLARNDMVYDTLTNLWEEGLFTGNGLLGAMLYMENDQNLRLEIGRTDVRDHREGQMSPLFAKCRLPIGHFTLSPRGRIIKNTARLDLWNAQAKGIVLTDKGSIKWRTMTLAEENLIVFETWASGDELGATWQWHPENSISSRTRYFSNRPEGYTANPAYKLGEMSGVKYCSQPLFAGGDYTTAWKKKDDGGHSILFITVANNQKHSSVSKAIRTVNHLAGANFGQLVLMHRRWWHSFYPRSFISVPDARMESFYWIQQYKFGSATRSTGPAIDLMGPWFRYTPWPAYWFNLNIELTYSPLFAANRLPLVQGYTEMIDKAQKNLIQNVPREFRYNAAALGRSGNEEMYSPIKVYPQLDSSASEAELELGNLTWCLYYYWLSYRYSMDTRLAKKLFPILKRSINYYLDVMTRESDGKLHLPYTYSPEYPGGITRDCNYDLSLFRWGCSALLELAPNDHLALKWMDVLTNLTDYPKDSSGLRIGRDLALTRSHRHYSHLLMIYPLSLLRWDRPGDRALIAKSLQHWHSSEEALQGYSYTGGASIYALMGLGNQALDYLDRLFDSFVKPNTMYLESGPVIETPLAAVCSFQEMLLQSIDREIKVFPAVPEQWKAVSFRDLRAQGAFLISAVRREGLTKWVLVKSEAGGLCKINPGFDGPVTIKRHGKYQVVADRDGYYTLNFKKGEQVLFFKDSRSLSYKNTMVNPVFNEINFWGKKR